MPPKRYGLQDLKSASSKLLVRLIELFTRIVELLIRGINLCAEHVYFFVLIILSVSVHKIKPLLEIDDPNLDALVSKLAYALLFLGILHILKKALLKLIYQ